MEHTKVINVKFFDFHNSFSIADKLFNIPFLVLRMLMDKGCQLNVSSLTLW